MWADEKSSILQLFACSAVSAAAPAVASSHLEMAGGQQHAAMPASKNKQLVVTKVAGLAIFATIAAVGLLVATIVLSIRCSNASLLDFTRDLNGRTKIRCQNGDCSQQAYEVHYKELQSYGYKNALFAKEYSFDRPAPKWVQSNLISGASRNEAVATIARSVLMHLDKTQHTNQLPTHFDIRLHRPAHVGDIEVCTFSVEFVGVHAKVLMVGSINGINSSSAEIGYKHMTDIAALQNKGYSVRSEL